MTDEELLKAIREIVQEEMELTLVTHLHSYNETMQNRLFELKKTQAQPTPRRSFIDRMLRR